MSGECRAYLVLENGRIFKGFPMGADGEVIAEVVFATGVTGYIETLTDKSYYGQIVAQTFPLIGNYGIIPEDFEADKARLSGYIVKDWCRHPSNFRSQGNLDSFLKAQGIPGLCGIDTRALTRAIRENGVMNGMITRNAGNADLDKIRSYKVSNAVKSVTCPASYVIGGENSAHSVVLIDFGMKMNIARELARRGCRVTVVPSYTSAEEILAMNPDGIMLSNGPGDPAENADVIRQLRRLSASGIPIFGICLGHQLLALANGFSTAKMKYGHRGANQPVHNLTDGKIFVSSQNHGYAVTADSIDKSTARTLFSNGNDGTVEGIEYTAFPAFSVQFHPEGCSGPMDTGFLFDKFIAMMK